MNNISINCGFCRKTKGCKIKKDIRSFFSSYELKYDKFKLKCPLYEYEYKELDKVVISIGYGAHKVINEVDCWFDCDHHSCSNCKFSDKCDDGLITFRNKKYKGHIEFNGEVVSGYNRTKYVVRVLRSDFNNFSQFNRYDKLIYNAISEKAFDQHTDYLLSNENNSDYIYFFTNRRNLKEAE